MYRSAHKFSFPVVVMPDEDMVHLYRVRGVPLTLVLDDQARVVFSKFGLIEPEALDSLLEVVRTAARSTSPP